MATLKIKGYDEDYEAILTLEKYSTNDRLAIMAYLLDGEPWGRLTVNVPSAQIIDNETEACIDINNWRDIEEFIAEYKLGEPTGRYAQSGYVTYPIYKFDLNTIKQYMSKE